MEEDPEEIPESDNEPYGFLEKELNGIKLNSVSLNLLLEHELQRKAALETRAAELQRVTHVEVKARAAELRGQIKEALIAVSKRRVEMNKVAKASLPSQIEHPGVYRRLENIEDLEKTSAYITVCHFIMYISEKMQTDLSNGLNSKAIDYLIDLRTLKNYHLQGTECANILSYCSNIVKTWEEELETKFSKDFEDYIGRFGWPAIETFDPTLEAVEKFHSIIRCLTRTSSTRSEYKPPETAKSGLLIDFKDQLVVVKLLTKPLRKRFRFHFCSGRPTSDDTKPEWYFSQVKHWIRDLIPFVKTHLEPITTSEANRSSIVDFVQSLSEVLILKTDVLVTANSSKISDSLFSKILEESIRYEAETRDLLALATEAQQNLPSFVNVLYSQPHILNRWLSIERKSCLDKLDELFASPTAWKRAAFPGPAEIGDLFVVMLRFVVNRFAHLRQPGQKLQFLELLLEVLDDFRIRSLQIWKTEGGAESNTDILRDVPIDFIIAETLRHIQISIENWEDEPFFSSLAYFYGTLEAAEKKEKEAMRHRHDSGRNSSYSRDDPTLFTLSLKSLSLLPDLSDERSTTPKLRPSADKVFSEVQSTYNILAGSILAQWCEQTIHEFKNILVERGYMEIRWHSNEEIVAPGEKLSPQIVFPLHKLEADIQKLYASMESSLAEEWLETLAVQLDKWIMESIIWPNRFVDDSIIQVQFDLLEGLFPLFSNRRVKPSQFFNNINCVLRIWEMPLGDSMLLYETLQADDVPYREQEEALIEAELSYMTFAEVMKLLRTRIEVNSSE